MSDFFALRTVTGAVLLVTLTGCFGSSDLPELGEVTGVVTFDGQPLANGGTVKCRGLSVDQAASCRVPSIKVLPWMRWFICW